MSVLNQINSLIEPLDIEDEKLLEEEIAAPQDSQRYFCNVGLVIFIFSFRSRSLLVLNNGLNYSMIFI